MAAILLVAAVAFVIWFSPARARKPELGPVFAPPTAAPLGTNDLKIGARLYYPHGEHRLVWTVVDLEKNFDFPDDNPRPGVRVRGTNSAHAWWVPRNTIEKLLVVQ